VNRLLGSARCDLELQARNGLLLATIFVTLISVALLRALPSSGIARLLPAVALNSMGITAFFFSAALVLLERAEGSSIARLVTPLRPIDYLTARAGTLALLALIQNGAIALALLGFSPALLVFVAGAGLAALILALCGFAATHGQSTLSQLLLSAAPWLMLLLAPVLPDLLGWRSPLLWLHPLQGPLVLMRTAVASTEPGELAIAIVASAGWVGAAMRLAARVYRQQAIPVG
jgi:fluoroquinolone transport system permease protein